MVKIVISYRRQDSAAISGRIRDRLASEFGSDSVFMDIDNIPIGVNFRDYIANALKNTDMMLVIIGPHWAGDRKRKTRIQNPTDPVRVELEKAFELGIRIWPVLVDDAIMPDPHMLPEPLKELSDRNAATVDTGRDFHAHMDRLIRQIKLTLGSPSKNEDRNSALSASLSDDADRSQANLKTDPTSEAKKSKAGFLNPAKAAVIVTLAVAATGLIGWLVYPKPRATNQSPPVSSTNQSVPIQPTPPVSPTTIQIPPTQPNVPVSPSTPAAVACSDERALRSLGTLNPTSILFVNRTSETRKIYWLDFNGTRVVYGTLQPGQSISLQTYITHPWVVTDGADTCLAIYMPTPSPQSIEITR